MRHESSVSNYKKNNNQAKTYLNDIRSILPNEVTELDGSSKKKKLRK